MRTSHNLDLLRSSPTGYSWISQYNSSKELTARDTVTSLENLQIKEAMLIISQMAALFACYQIPWEGIRRYIWKALQTYKYIAIWWTGNSQTPSEQQATV